MVADNKQVSPKIELISATGWVDYELIDSGNGAKLERFGPYTFVRPEHQAVWQPALTQKSWQNADADFISTGEESGGHWGFRKSIPETWPMTYRGLTFLARPSNSRHLGVFPEQAVHWDWSSQLIQNAQREINVLNLFGYTGVASLAAAKAGAKVTHLDASKKTVNQARENQLLSHLENAPIRWIVDDALKFVRREVKRGAQYQGIILDPPKFGRGPKGEVWEFFEMLPNLLREIRPLLVERPLFLVITAYAIRASALTLFYALQEMLNGMDGRLSAGELVTQESSAGRRLSLAIFARWSAENMVRLANGRQE
jgi:23S rRNA (cytosine1962-C5)-methyltransferase